MRKTSSLVMMLAMVLGALVMLNSGSVRASSVTPVVIAGNPDCDDLGYDFGFKLDFAPANGSYSIDGVNYVTIANTDGTYFDWTSTLGIDAVIVKGGTTSNLYTYSPDESFGDSGLHPPVNASGNPAGISHIEFCYDYELTVSKTAATTFTRTYAWTIEKSVTPARWDLFSGDSGTSQYTVAVQKIGFNDSDWAVSGEIRIENNTPLAATITSIADTLPGVTVDLNCPDFAQPLAAWGSLTCTYSAALPDASSRTNTATVTTSGIVGGGTATAAVNFGEPTTKVNDTIHVNDTYAGSLGAANDSMTFAPYSRTFTCDADQGTHDNTATIFETDQSASASVTVNCYSLAVSKDALTSFDRTWSWTIAKSADQARLLLTAGQSFLINYSVEVNATSADGNYAVAGTIQVNNPAPLAATINGVADLISGMSQDAVTVDCGVTFPYSLAAGGTLTCGYSAGLPDNSARLNTATATLQNYAYAANGSATPNGTSGFSGTADVAFSATPSNEIDECVDVTDTFAGTLGRVCANTGQSTFTFTYTRTVSYAECGEYTVDNTASFVAIDTGASGSATVNIPVTVPCASGCTLTVGYWKTHSKYGPAPYDDTWALIGEDTPFYSSGQSYYQVLWTAPKGNVYYILAHQYIAAKLNGLNGASSTPEVNAALTWAHNFFTSYTPTSSLSKSVRNQAATFATLLDNYNNGLVGPGHCSE